MAPSCAPHVTRKMVREVLDPAVEDRSKPPFAYVLNHVPPAFTDPSKPLYETEEEALAQKTLRESLALQAQTRYEQWLEENPAPKIVGEPSRSTHPTHHMFRVRTREKELAPKHWQNPNRVLHERERIEAVLDSALYMRHPPYPKQGGGIKNLGFSYMSAAYDYRQRQPSKEVSGTVSMLRTRPRTESERINKSLQEDSLLDTLSGGRWTFDPKYGNPPHCSPATVSSPFRSNSPQRWLRAARGGFERSFPPGTADTQTLYLHHNEQYAEHIHPMVAPNVRAGAGSRQREPEKEVDLNHSFSSSVPLNTYLHNPSRLCTWNMEQPPASLRPPATADAAVKTYRRAVTTQVSYRAGLV
eukprot:Transcript_28137.p1 GENE.Transcript_28137~~Transcript_28137.p1  ORF type:complete len:383 (-),score=113.61 Transcript_28137:43-1113(-)